MRSGEDSLRKPTTSVGLRQPVKALLNLSPINDPRRTTEQNNMKITTDDDDYEDDFTEVKKPNPST